MQVVVVGGGVGGLGAALAFARQGHAVTVVEQDEWPAIDDPEAAFAAERRGAPQVHQTHGFLARIAVVLRDRFPDVLDALRVAGCTTMPVTVNLGEPRPGDDDLRVLIVRRTTFEWILRRAVLAEPGIEVRTGARVLGVRTRDAAPPVVDGVQLDDGSVIDADLVVAATGRRGDIPGWLAPSGVEIAEIVHESGLMYLSRWYRLPDGAGLTLDPKLGGDLGFVKYLGVPGDAGTLSVTLAIRRDDSKLRAALLDSDRFDDACRALPGPDQFFTHDLQPIGGVRPMGGLLNRLRRFVDADGTPNVLGFHAVGDAHTCTNPLYGRGCSLALVQAVLLADAVAAHPGDLAAITSTYESACAREVEPWFHVSVQMDRLGADPAGLVPVAGSTSERTASPAADIGALFVAAATDPIIGRAMARFWNLLATPAELMADAELLGRIAEVMANPDAYPLPPREGPTRAELLARLGAAASDLMETA